MKIDLWECSVLLSGNHCLSDTWLGSDVLQSTFVLCIFHVTLYFMDTTCDAKNQFGRHYKRRKSVLCNLVSFEISSKNPATYWQPSCTSSLFPWFRLKKKLTSQLQYFKLENRFQNVWSRNETPLSPACQLRWKYELLKHFRGIDSHDFVSLRIKCDPGPAWIMCTRSKRPYTRTMFSYAQYKNCWIPRFTTRSHAQKSPNPGRSNENLDPKKSWTFREFWPNPRDPGRNVTFPG